MVNDLGVDPNEWFTNPLDSMPVATNGTNRYHPDGDPPSWEDTAPSEYEPDFVNPLDSMPVAKDWFKDEPEEKEETMHEKMYKIATSRYNPFSVGGSENCDSDISCNIGGSEQAHDKT